jgi:hypothetical protein
MTEPGYTHPLLFGVKRSIFAPGDGGKPRNARLVYPHGIACDAMGNIYLADYGDERVRRITVK